LFTLPYLPTFCVGSWYWIRN